VFDVRFSHSHYQQKLVPKHVTMKMCWVVRGILNLDAVCRWVGPLSHFGCFIPSMGHSFCLNLTEKGKFVPLLGV